MFHIVTPNTALDRWVTVPELTPGGLHRAESVETRPAGKGVNVARALWSWGADPIVYGMAGGPSGEQFRLGLESEGIPHVLTPIGGETRVNTKVREGRVPGRVTEINEGGPLLTDAEETAFVDSVCSGLSEGHWLIVSGSLPPGVSPALYVACMVEAKNRSCRIALDVPGETLGALLEASPVPPDVVIPNARELAAWAGGGRVFSGGQGGFEWVRRPQALRDALKAMADRGVAYPYVTLGGAGAALWTGEALIRTRALDVPVRDVVGCGDVFLAAVVHALDERGPVVALRLATALAGLKATRDDGRPPDWFEGETYLDQVPVQAL